MKYFAVVLYKQIGSNIFILTLTSLIDGGSFWPALVFSHITQWKVILTPKICSKIIFLIIRHLLISQFQQSMKYDPPFLSVKVDQCMLQKLWKHQRVPLKQKKDVSDFVQILCVRPFDHKDLKIWDFFLRKKFIFFYFYLMLKTSKKF